MNNSYVCFFASYVLSADVECYSDSCCTVMRLIGSSELNYRDSHGGLKPAHVMSALMIQTSLCDL